MHKIHFNVLNLFIVIYSVILFKKIRNYKNRVRNTILNKIQSTVKFL